MFVPFRRFSSRWSILCFYFLLIGKWMVIKPCIIDVIEWLACATLDRLIEDLDEITNAGRLFQDFHGFKIDLNKNYSVYFKEAVFWKSFKSFCLKAYKAVFSNILFNSNSSGIKWWRHFPPFLSQPETNFPSTIMSESCQLSDWVPLK